MTMKLLSFIILAMMTSMLFGQDKPRAPRDMKVTFASATLFLFTWNGDKLADHHTLYIIDQSKKPLWGLRVESSKACKGVLCSWSARPSDPSKFQNNVLYRFSAFSHNKDIRSNEGGPTSFIYTRDAVPPSTAGSGSPPTLKPTPAVKPPTPAAKPPTPAPKSPTPAPKSPTPAPKSPTPAAKPPTPTTKPPTTTTKPPTPAAKPTPATKPPTPATKPTTNGNNGRGFNLPPSHLTRGLGFGEWRSSNASECSQEIHNSFWALGPDGKVYHTWHPTSYTDRAGNVCYFGHEHGDDPKTSKTFGKEVIPFGYVNDVYKSSNPSSVERKEDHVGHKIQVQNDIQIWFRNNRSSPPIATCDAVIKIHMGVHSNDAFVNNLHEMFFFLKCSDGRAMKIKYLNPFGTPGQCSIVDQCPPRVAEKVRPDKDLLPYYPPNSPWGEGTRKLVDRQCVETYWLKSSTDGPTQWGRNNGEHWTVEFSKQYMTKSNQQITFIINPYLTVFDPLRFFDPSQTTKGSYPPLFVGYAVDQCFLTGNRRARGPECEALRKSGIRPPHVWNSTISPFKGTKRNFSPNRVKIFNKTPVKTFYTNALMDVQSFSETPFKNSIQHYLDGNVGDNEADIFMFDKDWNAPGIHAPN